MAVCEYRAGRIPEGNENLEIAIRNKRGFPTPGTGIMAAFQALVEVAIASHNEQALLDFIGNNRGGLIIPPYRMHRYSQVFLKLAADATGADMPRTAMALYQFVPSTDAALDDIRARLRAMGPLESVRDGGEVIVRKELEDDLASLEEIRRGKYPPEALKLVGTAVLHEQCGNIRGAWAAYRQLESFYPSSASREDNLFNLVRTSAVCSSAEETRLHAETFLAAFADSPRASAVRSTALDRLFRDGRYDECIRMAASQPDKATDDPEARDLRLHVLGASYFHTGRFKEALPLLERHAEAYPESGFAMATAYFRAACVSRLGDGAKAMELLDSFIRAYPAGRDNIYLPFALLELADRRFSSGMRREALEPLDRITREFPGTDAACRAWNQRGFIELGLGNTEDARASWTRALETADARHDKEAACDALASLVCLLARPGEGADARMKDAIGYARRFWNEDPGDSPRCVRVAIAQVRPLQAVGHGEEALERLRQMIAVLARTPREAELDALVRAHSKAYLSTHRPEELKSLYHDFPGIGPDDRAVSARLRIAVIDAYENSGDATVARSLYQELKTVFAMKELPASILVRIGDHLRLMTSTPRESLPYYDEVIGREDSACRAGALLGRADVLAHSGVPAEVAKAVADLERLLKEFPDDSFCKHARERLAEIKAGAAPGN